MAYFQDSPFNPDPHELQGASGQPEPRAQARALNATPSYVGFIEPQAVIWGAKTFPPTVLSESGRAEDINDLNPPQIVGLNTQTLEAVIWENDGTEWTETALNDLIHPAYTDANNTEDNINLRQAHAINNNSWIVAVGDGDPGPQIVSHGYVLVPSEDVLDSCPEDVNNDGEVDVTDLLALLEEWGTCPIGSLCFPDFEGDGQVDTGDLLELLGAWGDCVGDPEAIPQTVQDCMDRFEAGSLELEHCLEAVESQQ